MRQVATATIEMTRTAPTVPTRTDRDSSLVTALRRGDPRAVDDLVTTYGARAGRLAMRITGNAEDAEEIVQDAFLSVIRKIDTFRGDSAFGSWLYRIVANAAYQRLRSRRGRSADLSLDDLLPVFDGHGRHVAPVADWSMSLVDPARQTELRMVLGAAIEELPAEYRPSCCCATSRGSRIGKSVRRSASPKSTSRRECTARGCSCGSGWKRICPRRTSRPASTPREPPGAAAQLRAH